MLKSENCPWQKLVNESYDAWELHDKEVMDEHVAGNINAITAHKRMWEFGDMLVHSDTLHQIACVLGKMNEQIENGGVIQWVDNGYAHASIDYLQDCLTDCGPVGQKIWGMLKPFLELYIDENGDKRHYDDECDYEEAYNLSDGLSDEFYAVSDDWHNEVYALLERLQQKQCVKHQLCVNGEIEPCNCSMH